METCLSLVNYLPKDQLQEFSLLSVVHVMSSPSKPMSDKRSRPADPEKSLNAKRAHLEATAQASGGSINVQSSTAAMDNPPMTLMPGVPFMFEEAIGSQTPDQVRERLCDYAQQNQAFRYFLWRNHITKTDHKQPQPRPENVSFASVSTAVEDKLDEQMGNENQYRAVRDTTTFIDRSIKRIVRELRSQLRERPHAQIFQTHLSAIYNVWRISKIVVGLDGEDGRLVRETFMTGNPLSNAFLKLASSYTGSEKRRVLGAVDEDGVMFRAKMNELAIFFLEEHGCVVMPDLEEAYEILVGVRGTQTSDNGKGFDSESKSEGSRRNSSFVKK